MHHGYGLCFFWNKEVFYRTFVKKCTSETKHAYDTLCNHGLLHVQYALNSI
jgi:hypothetical protein